jgi:hypothetical protein
MASTDILELARQGDPKVLEAVINHSLRAQGVSAKVRRQDNYLHLLVEAPRLLNSEKMAEALYRLFQNLGLHSDFVLKVYHRQAGERAIAWEQELDLRPLSSHAHIPTEPEVQPPEYSDPVNPTVERSSVTIQEPPHSDNVAIVPAQPAGALSPQEPNPAELLFADGDGVDEATSNLLQRPESVVLLLFVSIVLLWEFYLDLIDAGNTDGPLSGRGLARRLGVNSSTISRRKDRPDFTAWTKDLDPDGIAWSYEDGLFMPKWVEN